MPKAVIFDLDGTLTDTSIDIFESLNKTLSYFGYDAITVEETKRFVGNGARKLVERAIKVKSLPENFDEILSFYNKTYNYCGSPKTCVYDGMTEVLTKLKDKGYKIAVVSNKPQQGVDEVCKKFFSEIKLDMQIGQTDGIKMKPFPDVIFYAIDKLGVKKEDVVLVGDSDVDYLTGKNAGVKTVSVLWGFRKRAELEKLGANIFCDSPEKLLKLF